ncbi:MAG TPA: hypothetical protein DCP84_15800 [Pseudomonas sp.]|nr:hypothetical protein [Pseudomonas sp.]
MLGRFWAGCGRHQPIKHAHAALRPAVRTPPLTRSQHLSATTGVDVWLKCEHLQPTGSFKFCGASNKVRLLPVSAREHGVIAASSGNHDQALALAGKTAGVPVTLYTTTTASTYKVEAMRNLGAEVICLPTDPLSAELEAARQAQAKGVPFVSPYNDLQVIAGQGTIGMELFEQAPDLDAVFVAVGGGGMIAGIGAALRTLAPGVDIIGRWPCSRTKAGSRRCARHWRDGSRPGCSRPHRSRPSASWAQACRPACNWSSCAASPTAAR